MTEKNDNQFAGEFIDLRELITTLWAKKWIILGVIVLAGLTTFLVTKFLMAEEYQASAFLTITDPALLAELETSIQANLIELETSGLPDLAESGELQQLAFGEIGVSDPADQRAFVLTASLHGEDQLELVAKAEDPNLAAEAANAWAGVVMERLNSLYGTEQDELISLEKEVFRAEENWSAAQLALETYLPGSRLNSLGLQLSAARSKLAKQLREINSNQLIISDTQTLLKQIQSLESVEILDNGTVLSLITLQQRAVTQEETPLQIQFDPSRNVDLTSSEAVVILHGLLTALDYQNDQLALEVAGLEAAISDFTLSLEKEEYQVDQLTQYRDFARQSYTALSSQLEETRITLAQQDLPVKIGVKAVVPNEPSGPRVLLYTMLAILSGSVIAISGALIVDWWYQEGRTD